MKFLLDAHISKVGNARRGYPDIVLGQLLTPLTSYTYGGHAYAIDNGAFTDFRIKKYRSMLLRQKETKTECLFVTAPDVVGSARRTLEMFDLWYPELEAWPIALVVQDGQENLPIPWDLIAGVFIGGTTHFKMSNEAAQIIKAAKIAEKHTHVGRVNTPRRYNHFAKLGVDTCDGSGASRWDWMLESIKKGVAVDHPLFEAAER